jgi:proteasome lid subunit RPN8/RPN11
LIAPKVIIGEEAFVMMLAGATEVYDKETYGLLIGKKRKKDYHVQYAVPHQSSRRYSYGVAITHKHEKKLIQAINFLKGYKYLGEFHSHPDSFCKLSKHDIKDMRESGRGVSVVLAIEPADRYRKWEYDRKDKRLHGTIDDSFYVEIKAYKCHHDGGRRIVKLRLECEFIKKLNKRTLRHFPSLIEQLPKKKRGRRKN